MSTDYDALAAWAESDFDLNEGPDKTALVGEAAAADGRATLAKAGIGRPRLGGGTPGTRSPRRQVRFPAQENEVIDLVAKALGVSASEFIRSATEDKLREIARAKPGAPLPEAAAVYRKRADSA